MNLVGNMKNNYLQLGKKPKSLNQVRLGVGKSWQGFVSKSGNNSYQCKINFSSNYDCNADKVKPNDER